MWHDSRVVIIRTLELWKRMNNEGLHMTDQKYIQNLAGKL
jgi:hypothetical protein